MEPKIVFLGTGGDSVVTGKARRSAAGIIIKVDKYQLHIDPGPGTIQKAAEFGVSLRETNAILASHGHINHAHDINALINAMTYNGLDAHGVIVAAKSVIEGSEEENIAPSISPYFKKFVEKIITLEAGKRVGVENMEIHALKTKHSDESGIGFKIYTPYFKLCYSGDTAYSKEIANQYKDSDILVLNVVYPGDVKSRYNLTAEDAEKILKIAKPKLCILTHFGNKFLAADPLYQAREMQKATGVQVIAAVDGLELNPLSYAARMNDKTLNLYS